MKPLSHARAPKGKLAEAPVSSSIPAADVIAAARAICDAFGGGVRKGGGIPAVAARIGMQPGVLYNKLSGSEDAYYRLTVSDVILIGLATGRLEHLQALGRTMSCAVFPVPDFAGLSDTALLDLICKANKEGGDFHRALAEGLKDGEIDAADLARIDRECFEWIGAIAEARARVRGIAHG